MCMKLYLPHFPPFLLNFLPLSIYLSFSVSVCVCTCICVCCHVSPLSNFLYFLLLLTSPSFSTLIPTTPNGSSIHIQHLSAGLSFNRPCFISLFTTNALLSAPLRMQATSESHYYRHAINQNIKHYSLLILQYQLQNWSDSNSRPALSLRN